MIVNKQKRTKGVMIPGLCLLWGMMVVQFSLVGTEEKNGPFSTPFPPSLDADAFLSPNCSQFTLKLGFSTKVVKHGK